MANYQEFSALVGQMADFFEAATAEENPMNIPLTRRVAYTQEIFRLRSLLEVLPPSSPVDPKEVETTIDTWKAILSEGD